MSNAVGQFTGAVTPAGSQGAAIEQARAAMEVQAAVAVAQANPRSEAVVMDSMRSSCSRYATAVKAKYNVPNRGTGASVHLARELARIWGNLDYGVRELSRDDVKGESEIQAYAWDQQTNVRSIRSFIVPHERMARKQRNKLVDLGDIYLNNQNQGAKAVRECIFAVLPPWFKDEALDLCEQTLQRGADLAAAPVPVADRTAKMLAAFAGVQVTEAQISKRLGKAKADWTEQDIASLTVVYQSITAEGIAASEFFEVEGPQVGALMAVAE